MDGCRAVSICCLLPEQGELQGLPDLARTKICKQMIQTGCCEDRLQWYHSWKDQVWTQCQDPTCTYAHNREESLGS